MFRRILIGVVCSFPINPMYAIDGAPKGAVEKGVKYFQKYFATPEACEKDDIKTGEVALCGLAMLEAGVQPNDPALTNIINFVRKKAATETQTYHIATCILFLDKLCEVTNSTADRPWIQLLGVRLYAGMNAAGGWSYASWAPVSVAEEKAWIAALTNAKATDKLHPEVAKLHAVVAQTLQARGRNNDLGDNSNTQFGAVALWVASRHGVPAKDAFALIERRYLNSWHKDGGWSYNPGELPTMPMTCAGLIGLAIGEASRVADAKPEKPEAAPAKDDPFFNPKKPAEVRKPTANAARADMVARAILGLGQAMSATKIDAGSDHGLANQKILPYTGTGNAYYLIWSVERVAVAYGLDTFAEVDWYHWGSNYILSMQNQDGSWSGLVYSDRVNTAFAMLFLLKANSYRDLTGKMAGRVKDPGVKELRATPGSKPLFDPNAKPTPATAPKPEAPSTVGSFPATTGPATKPTGAVETTVQQLIAAKELEWPAKLAAVRDAKGSESTEILVQLATITEGDRRKLAREYLADRLTRMTAKSLQTMIQGIEPELRRGACLACGMKELDESIPWLIGRLSDPSDNVAKAALASLKSLSGKDFGPEPGANEEARLRAAAAWRAWYEMRGK